MSNSSSKKPPSIPLSHDPDTGDFVQDVPTVTSLLRRKKAVNSNSSAKSRKPPAPAADEFVVESNQLRTNVTQSAPREPGQYSKIQPSGRRAQTAPKKKIPTWKLDALKAAEDPHSRAAWSLIENGAIALLWLKAASEATPHASASPLWLASQAWGPRELLSLWNGLKWDPTLHAGPWATLLGTGFYEISPSLKGDWSAVRRVFGAQSTDYLAFFKTGPSECFVVIAPKALTSLAKQVLAQFTSASTGKQVA
jgi:hypothetical protein